MVQFVGSTSGFYGFGGEVAIDGNTALIGTQIAGRESIVGPGAVSVWVQSLQGNESALSVVQMRLVLPGDEDWYVNRRRPLRN